ncbi:MAG: hypothetical protein JSS95_08355 [Acidobacteria bacterium]|nr:hypothetical protein [Acidobacteriota bacterium]
MRTLLCIMLLCTSFAIAAPNPSDYNVNVHVVESKTRYYPNPVRGYQQITVVIDGYKYELEALSEGVLALGDYKAKLTETSKNGYDINRTYTFLLPDGKTRDFNLSGILQ